MPNQTHQHVATSAGIPFAEETMRARLAVVGLAGFATATFVCGFPLLVRPQACSEIVRNGSPGDQLLLVCRSTAMTLGMYVTFALVRALITAFLEQSPIDTTDSAGSTNRINRLVRVAFQSALITAVATAPAVATPTRLTRPQKVNSVTIDTKPHDSVVGDSVLVESVPVEQVSVVSVSVDASGQRWPVFGATRPPLTGVPRQPTPGSKIPTFGPPYVPATTVAEPSTTSLGTTSPATTSPTTTAPSTTSPTTTSPTASVVNTTLPIAATPTSASAPSAQSASTDQVRPGTWVVKGGESFWSIAEQLARTSNQQAAAQTVGSIWTQLIEYNRANLPVPGLPDLLYPGQVLVVPPDVVRD
jgi:nucleoid-associated protein YgaU